MLGSTWLTVFAVELAVISIINGFTILTFARNRHLRKRTKYLIINLSIADFFVGTVSGPMHIYHLMTFKPGSGFGWGKFIVMFLDNVFTACSVLQLAMLSLERLHATLFPFRHCLIGSLRFDDGNVSDNARNQWFDWLNEEKQPCGTCGTLFAAMFLRSLPNDDVRFSYLRFLRQHELAAVNLSFLAFTWKPFVPCKRKCTSPILYNVINMA